MEILLFSLTAIGTLAGVISALAAIWQNMKQVSDKKKSLKQEIFNTQQEKQIKSKSIKETQPLYHKQENSHRIKLNIDEIANYLPYSINREDQIDSMSACLRSNISSPIWIVHGDYNQCIDEFLHCIRLFHWKHIYPNSRNPSPEIIQFTYPDAKNAVHFEYELYQKIWMRLNNDNEKNDLPLDTNLEIDKNHIFKNLNTKKGVPTILYTKIIMDDWNKSLFLKLTQLSAYLNSSEQEPKILCVLIIYYNNIGPFYKRMFSKKNKIIKDLKKYCDKLQFIPELSDVKKEDVINWFLVQYGFPKRDEVDDFFSDSSLPMQELAKKIKTNYSMKSLANKY